MWRAGKTIAICILLCISLPAWSIAAGPKILEKSVLATGTGNPAAGMFLVATRALAGPVFGESVVYLVAHGEGGTLGLIVNRASDIRLSEAAPDLPAEQTGQHALFYGGPVGLPMTIMLGRGESVAEGMLQVADGVYISSEKAVIEEALAGDNSQRELRFYVGYAGWAAGQLDFEIAHGSWHVVPADPGEIFSAQTDSLWDRLIEKLEPPGIQADRRPGSTSPAVARVTGF